MNNAAVLLVEDDYDLQEIMAQFLTRKGFDILRAETLADGIALYEKQALNIALIDIILPDGSGLELLAKIREKSALPVILMTSLGKDADVIKGLAMGANDYIAKPCALDVVFARIQTQLNMAKFDIRNDVTLGGLRLDKSTGRAYLNEKDITLTPKEFALLLYLVQHAGQTLASEQIYQDVWGLPLNKDTAALRSHIYALRQKLKDTDNTIIETRGKLKYIFRPENLINC